MKKIIFSMVLLAIVGIFAFANGKTEKRDYFEVATSSASEANVKSMEFAFAKFKEKYPNYPPIKLTTGNNLETTKRRMTTSDQADVFALSSPADMVQFAKQDLLYDLTETSDAEHWKDKIFDWAYALSKYKGKVYGIPYGYEGMVMWFHKDIMKKNGWTYPTTLDEFETLLQNAQDKGLIPIILGSQAADSNQEWYMSILFSYVGREKVKNALEGKNNVTWTDEDFKEVVNRYKKWHDKGWLMDGKSMSTSNDDSIALFIQKKALFKLEGTWATYWILPLSEEERNNIGVALHPPVMKNGITSLPLGVGSVRVVAKSTQYPEMAKDLLTFLITNQEVMANFVLYGRDTAPTKIDEKYLEKLQPISKSVLQLMGRTLAKGNYSYTTWAFYPPQTRVYTYEGIKSVLTNDITVDTYLENLQKINDKEREAGDLPVIP